MKLSNYIDLSQRNLGTIPDDIPRYVRTTADIPVTLKGEITRILAQSDWKERPIPDPTLLTRNKSSPQRSADTR
jgi:acetyl-CoA decarbonylase/synthase complex subunit alpha